MDSRIALVTQKFFICLLKRLRYNVLDVRLHKSPKPMKRITNCSGHNKDCSRALPAQPAGANEPHPIRNNPLRYLRQRRGQRDDTFSKSLITEGVSPHTVSAAGLYLAAGTHSRIHVTFGPVLSCQKTHLASSYKQGKALSLGVDDFGRRRRLTRPRPVRQLPVVSAFRVSEG